MANTVYTNFKKLLMEGTFNLSSDSFNVALMSAYTINAADTVYGTYGSGGTETSGTGYTAGGVALSGVGVTTSGTTAVWTASANPEWTGATFSAAYGIIYDTTHSNDLCGVWDFGGTLSVSGGTFEIELSASPVTGSIMTLA